MSKPQGEQRGSSAVHAYRKYLQLGREIAEVSDVRVRDNLRHTHSKLGIFLEEVIKNKWREAREIVSLESAVDRS